MDVNYAIFVYIKLKFAYSLYTRVIN